MTDFFEEKSVCQKTAHYLQLTRPNSEEAAARAHESVRGSPSQDTHTIVVGNVFVTERFGARGGAL